MLFKNSSGSFVKCRTQPKDRGSNPPHGRSFSEFYSLEGPLKVRIFKLRKVAT